MSWKFWEKWTGGGESKPPNPEDVNKLKKQLSRFMRTPKGAEAMAKLKALTDRMKSEGVDLKDEAAVRAWLEAHKGEVEAVENVPKGVPFAHAKAVPGRNEPCLCGSGKKFKKCCEAKQAV